MSNNHSEFLAKYLHKNFKDFTPEPKVIQDLSEAMLGGNIALETQTELNYEDLFVKDSNDFIYSKRLFETRNQIISRIKNLLSTSSKIIEEKDLNLSSQLNEEQRKACIIALQKNFSIITGGPGTGKTFTVSHILKNLLQHHPQLQPDDIIMVAPTGKAQARLKESLLNSGITIFDESQQELLRQIASQTVTIHRLLGKYNTYIKYHQEHPIPYKILIVDESSMIDMILFNHLLKAINPAHTKVIFLGDQYQLPPVGLGAVFKDLCNSDDLRDYRVELKESKRFHADSKIGKLAKAINEAEIDFILDNFVKNSHETTDNNEAIWIVANDRNEDLNAINDWQEYFCKNVQRNVSQFKIQESNFKILTEYAILCAMNKGKEGVDTVNQQIHQSLESYTSAINPFIPNQMVLVTSNQNDIGIFNGDIGIVASEENNVHYIYFPNGKKVKPQIIQNHQLGYALSIHKSQGSEYDNVLVLMSNANEKMLNRQLLYTAVTRAKKLVVIKTTKAILQQTIENNDIRITNIKNQF